MKAKEPTPDIYKIIYRLARWKTKSERYYPGFSAQEAFDDFYYSFMSGHVDSNCVSIYKVLRYDRFADKWYVETDQIDFKSQPNIKMNMMKRYVITR